MPVYMDVYVLIIYIHKDFNILINVPQYVKE